MTELESLKQKADLMGIKYHTSISADKLRTKIEQVTGTNVDEIKPVKYAETLGQKKARLRKEADVRLRVKVVCLNPAKIGYEGEIFEVGNSFIGTIKCYVPYNADAWHLPKAIIDLLREKEFLQHYTVTVNNKPVNKTKWVKEFQVVDLPPLTKEELKDLAKVQAARQNQD